MTQLDLFGYRTDYIREFENQIAWYCDILKERKDSITYAEHIVPHKGKAICGMEYEEYLDVNKRDLKDLTYDQILIFLKNTKPEARLNNLKKLLDSRNITYEADLWTWHNKDIA